jgi:transcriptional regulator with XRE-family HTH domain
VDTIADRIRSILRERGWSERALSERAGLSPVHIGKILDRGGGRAGADTLARIASAAGVSLDWLITGHAPGAPAEGSSHPVYRNLPGWTEAVTIVRRTKPYLPIQALEAAGETNALLVTGPVTPDMVLRQANTWLDNADPALLEQLDSERVKLEIAAAEARYDRALAMQEAMRARGETVPHVQELMRQLEKTERRTRTAAPANDDEPPAPPARSTTRRATKPRPRRKG